MPCGLQTCLGVRWTSPLLKGVEAGMGQVIVLKAERPSLAAAGALPQPISASAPPSAVCCIMGDEGGGEQDRALYA